MTGHDIAVLADAAREYLRLAPHIARIIDAHIAANEAARRGDTGKAAGELESAVWALADCVTENRSVRV